MAKQLHPDKNKGDPNAEERFRDLNDAYEALVDDEKRKIYNKHGEEGLKQRASGEHHFDPFASFFGDIFGSHQQGERETPKGGDVMMDLDVSLEEMYNGNFIEVIPFFIYQY